MPKSETEVFDAVMERLQERLDALGWSRPVLAESTGDIPKNVQNWMGRVVQKVPVDFIIRAASATDASLEWLLTGAGEPDRPSGPLEAVVRLDRVREALEAPLSSEEEARIRMARAALESFRRSEG